MTLVKTDLGVGDWGGAWAGTKIPMTIVSNSERGGRALSTLPLDLPLPTEPNCNRTSGSVLAEGLMADCNYTTQLHLNPTKK